MVGNGRTYFQGTSKEDLYKAIVNRKTTYGGSPTPLGDIILWSYKVVYESEKKLIRSFFCKEELNIPFYKKLLAMFSGLLYIGTPLPVISGILGNYYLKRKAKSKLKKIKREDPLIQV